MCQRCVGSLKLAVLAAMAYAFWTAVVHVQPPWQAVARRLASEGAPVPAETPPPPLQIDRRDDDLHEFHPAQEPSPASLDLLKYLGEIETTIGPERPRAIAPWERGLRWHKPATSAKRGWRHACMR